MWATDMLPWLGSSFELHATAGGLLQRSTRIPSGSHTIHDDNTGQLYFFGVQGAYEAFSLELEFFGANTEYRSLGFSHAKQTVRYQFLDDILGDADYSLTAGLSFAEVTTQTRDDVTFIHHGHFEGLLFLSLGKELSMSWTRWCQRAFGVVGLGIANRGVPWVVGNAYYEWAAPEGHIAGAGGYFDIGLGNKNVCLNDFKGYGNIRYRAFDLEAYYGYAFDRATMLKAVVDVRVYAYNCTQSVSFALMYLVSFGL